MTDTDDEIESGETASDDRTLGVEFGDLAADLDAHEYPATVDELLAEYGDRTLDLPGGDERFGEVLEPYSQDDQQFTDPGEVRQAVLNMVGVDAVGQPHYSDRGIEDDDSTDSF